MNEEFMMVIGSILVGIIFFAIAGIYIANSADKVPEYEVKGNAEKIVSAINQLSMQPSSANYKMDIPLSNIKIESGFLTLEQKGKKCARPVPKEVQDAELMEIASLCIMKQKNGEIIVKEKCS